jgi:hypothetical protein
VVAVAFRQVLLEAWPGDQRIIERPLDDTGRAVA